MDGITATEAIRKFVGPARNIPIIAVTANAMAADREIYIAAGMNDYVTKPVSPKSLQEVLARTMAPKSQPSPEREYNPRLATDRRT